MQIHNRPLPATPIQIQLKKALQETAQAIHENNFAKRCPFYLATIPKTLANSTLIELQDQLLALFNKRIIQGNTAALEKITEIEQFL